MCEPVVRKNGVYYGMGECGFLYMCVYVRIYVIIQSLLVVLVIILFIFVIVIKTCMRGWLGFNNWTNGLEVWDNRWDDAGDGTSSPELRNSFHVW